MFLVSVFGVLAGTAGVVRCNKEPVCPAITSLVLGVPSLVVPVPVSIAAAAVGLGRQFRAQFGKFGVLGTKFGSEFRYGASEGGKGLTISGCGCG